MMDDLPPPIEEPTYAEFLQGKSVTAPVIGMCDVPELSPRLFPFQRDLVTLSLRRGRSAIFADTGLGKGWMALEWLRVVSEHTGKPVLLLAPLAVSHQFAREAKKLGVAARVCASASDVGPGINITNYHKLAKFDPSHFAGVALDESSILKSYTASTRTELIEAFRNTPFRLALTATPSPNDHTELGNHAEFLGIMTRVEMLSMFFVHDGETTQEWRLKGHAEESFWRWVASWAVTLRRPSDLGYEDGAYDLPPLRHHDHVVAADRAHVQSTGMLFADQAKSLTEQRAVRRSTMSDRVQTAAKIANETKGPVVVWCEMNDEGDALEKSIKGCVQVAGANTDEEKEEAIDAFSTGKARVMVTKPSVAGFGLNWQHAHTIVFCGISNSFEQHYQSVRRCWRFGQTKPVDVHIVRSELDGRIVETLRRKHEDAQTMGNAMVSAMAEITKSEIKATTRTSDAYEANQPLRIPAWLVTEAT